MLINEFKRKNKNSLRRLQKNIAKIPKEFKAELEIAD